MCLGALSTFQRPPYMYLLCVHVPSCGHEVLLTVAQSSCRVTLDPSMSLLNQSWFIRWGAFASKEFRRISAIYILFSQFDSSLWACRNLISLTYWNHDCPAVQVWRLNVFTASAGSIVRNLTWSKQQVALFCLDVRTLFFTTLPPRNDRIKEPLFMWQPIQHIPLKHHLQGCRPNNSYALRPKTPEFNSC
jgi:hypothetical protein